MVELSLASLFKYFVPSSVLGLFVVPAFFYLLSFTFLEAGLLWEP